MAMLATIVTVMLDAFSGLTNPTWSLSPQDAGSLQQSVDRIVEQRSVEQPRIPDLGYRGLVIQGLDVQGKPAEVRIFRRWIIVGTDGDARAFQDKDNSLEMWLVELGRAQVPAGRIPADLFPQK
jgi:hypothetical protein